MKKLFLMTLMTIVSSVVFAQNSKWAAGIALGYGSEISQPSIGVKALYDINDKFTLAPSLNKYFKETEKYSSEGMSTKVSAKYWDFNFDLHWNVLSKESFRIYPFAGITYFHAKGEVTASDEDNNLNVDASKGKVGANLGVGGQFNFSQNWAMGLDLKYQIVDNGQFALALSVMYRF